MKTRTYFAHRIDKLDEAGEILEHVAGVEDFDLAEAVYRAARKCWPKDDFMLRQEARVIHDSRRETASDTADEKIDRRAPLGYFNYAASFHAAADLVFSEGLEATHPDAPTTFLYYQAVELYLKAFLRLTGVSAARLSWLGHDLRRLKSRAVRRGLPFGVQESQVLDWMAATKAATSARYLETGSTWTPPGVLIWEGCSNLKKTVAEAFRREGQPIQSPRFKQPFYDLFRPRSR